MAHSTAWYYEWNDGSYRPYEQNVTNWLNKAKIGEFTVMHIGSNQYRIHKLSQHESSQTNIRTQFSRKAIDQSKYDQLAESNKKSKATTMSTNTHHSHYNPKHASSSSHQWAWKGDKGSYIAYKPAVSHEIERLKIGESYFVFAGNSQYEIYKTSQSTATQSNLYTNKSRAVIRQSVQHHHPQHQEYAMDPNQEDVKQGYDDDEAIWHFMDKHGKYEALDLIVSERLDSLKIGETMAHNTMDGQFELKKSSPSKGKQRNVTSGKSTEIRKMSASQRQQCNVQIRHKPKPQQDHDEKKETIPKWYWKDDDGKYKPMGDGISAKLNNLTIGESIKQKVANSMYEFKRTAIGVGQQRNTRTKKVREIKVATYGWYYEENGKALKPFTSKVSLQIDACAVGKSFTFSLKSGQKYEIKKTSSHFGKQRNMATNTQRNIVYKMTLNDDGDEASGATNTSHQHTHDWVKQRESKAMKTGKIERCKLQQKRNLHEDEADRIFRQCESQFMRSCQNLGGAANGLNRTITEVEYIINPTLMKKFNAKKKKLMAKNKCDESKLNIILAWHGTPNTNIDGIVKSNFCLSKISANSGDKGWYGKGIYFSEYAKISLGYGKGLLLCKVMLGKSYKMLTSDQQTGRGLEKGYDSHTVVDQKGSKYGQEIVIFDVDQILP
eukprot:CAMPEP_0197022686 /NCGR_PEP_ID=MMETSP1384-20130603/3501_1 /TAXON_ID=29189 /ORGANISM="Ammonia sp." /LENGTH=663 /DNA_ID=CAMNT_0042450771 /DNA_START=8 /DNA_END=1996 /DNA_ORIENTATION=+